MRSVDNRKTIRYFCCCWSLHIEGRVYGPGNLTNIGLHWAQQAVRPRVASPIMFRKAEAKKKIMMEKNTESFPPQGNQSPNFSILQISHRRIHQFVSFRAHCQFDIIWKWVDAPVLTTKTWSCFFFRLKR